MMLQRTTITRTFRAAHMFCGIGAGAKGFNDANPRIGHLAARFECAGGIDVDAGALRNFERITGARGTLLDLFDREQYVAFHGRAPDAGWREATPADILAAFGPRLDVMFLSAPCKGFSGLLSAKASGTEKYQSLNRLTLRGVWLALEAYKDDPIPIVLFENVPRIRTRGRQLLDRIQALLRSYGYVFAETEHNCGEIAPGGLAQSRNRFLLVARHAVKVPPFLYQPAKSPLRGVGEVIGRLPLPGAPVAGPMHRVPSLQWKTWVRLAFVRAGADWRSLNDLRVENGMLTDFGIVPDRGLRDNQLGVLDWGEPAPTLTGQRSPAQGRFSVADPRVGGAHNDALGVRPWHQAARVVAGASRPANGAHCVADPRPITCTCPTSCDCQDEENGFCSQECPEHNIMPSPAPDCPIHTIGRVADPRPQQANQTFAQYGVRDWQDPAGTVTGQAAPGGGPNSVADPRLHGKPAYNNVFRIVPFDAASPAVAGPGGPANGLAVADPRSGTGFGGSGKYRVTRIEEPAGTVIAGSTTGQGAFAVADPRPTHGAQAHHNKMRVVDASAPAPTVTGSDRVGSGALSVADPRPAGLSDPSRDQRHSYNSQAHYGVLDWHEPTNAVPGYAKYDRGSWSVADPREQEAAPIAALPAPTDRLVARIVALDGTWHRPFTTLELAALQSLFDPGEVFDLEGGSDQLKREWIGNAVPSAAARGMAETIGETLLLATMGETFTLSSRAIWTKPLAIALSVDPRQPLDGIDA